MDLHHYFVGRWQCIHEFEKKELRQSSTTKRFLQFLSLLELARTMNWRTSMPEEDEEARRRWRKIKGLL